MIVGVYECVHAYMCMYVCLRVCACLCVRLFVCVCLCVCFVFFSVCICMFVETLCAGTAGYSDPRIWDRGAAAAVLNPHPTPPCRGVPSFLGTGIHAIPFAELGYHSFLIMGFRKGLEDKGT